jgi:hypothetical protein
LCRSELTHMFHHLWALSILLNSTLMSILPRLGHPGHLIPPTPYLSSPSASNGPQERLRHSWSFLFCAFHRSSGNYLPHSIHNSFYCFVEVKPQAFTTHFLKHTGISHPGITDNTWILPGSHRSLDNVSVVVWLIILFN